ncbi:MAG: hypothetical protein NTV51_29905 [Verrucomicrobia bacterium]|nr:hypothetical protein [Verrucomicrobiota bacterium]
MPAQPVFDLRLDPVRNVMRTRYAGHFTAAAMRAAAGQIATALPTLKPGFSALTDFSGVDAMDLDCVPHLTRIMDLCRDHGIATLIRVLPDPKKDIGINILSVVHYGRKITKVTVDTVEEAERALKN